MGDLIRRNICPNCGGTNLELDCLYQYGIIYKINKDGSSENNFSTIIERPLVPPATIFNGLKNKL